MPMTCQDIEFLLKILVKILSELKDIKNEIQGYKVKEASQAHEADG